MTSATKLAAGAAVPEFNLPLVGGGEAKIGGARDGWQLAVVYRGKHCPLCKKYLAKLEGLAQEFSDAGAEIVCFSADSEEQATADKADMGTNLPIAYGLSEDQMKALGLYISEPRSEQETDHKFPEPGVFLVNPQGQAQVIDISNAPFSRADLDGVLFGLKIIQEKNYPIRGTAA